MRYLVDVEGAEVEGAEVAVERPWSKRPRLLVDGHDLVADRWGRRLLTMPDGSQEEVEVGYRALFLAPRLEVAGRHYPIGRPLPVWVLVALGGLLVLGAHGGAAGALLAFGAAFGVVRLLIDPQRTRRHVVVAVALPVVAVVAYLLVANVIASLVG